MCGIAGILNLNGGPVSDSMVRRMIDAMAYRGPDGQGVHIEKNIGLGHRRLSIIDLSPAGHQPMTNEAGTLWLVFNGEIYNYVELCRELQEKGHRFRSRSDSEVILHSYEEWGEDCIQRFNGMWGFAIWDVRKNRLFLSRDRFGVKPLYYYARNGKFVFASEIKAILAVVPEARNPNYAYLHHFLSCGALEDGDETFFADVKTLLPAHSLNIEENGLRFTRHWHFDIDAVRKGYDYDHPAATFRDLLQDAVRLRLRSDVPLGTCLSGGLDSSSIVALASGLMDHPVKTFSVIYEDPDCNEQYFVDALNEHCKTDPYPVYPQAKDLFEILPKIVWHQDTPTGGPSVYSQWHVMQEARGRVKVLLDGQGGDELLGGYLFYFGAYLSSIMQDFNKGERLSSLRSFVRFVREIRRVAPDVQYWAFLAHCLPAPVKGALYRAARIARRVNVKPLAVAPPVLHPDFVGCVQGKEIRREYPSRFEHELDDLLYWQLVSQSIPALLHLEDRNSMAFSIEARTPFLDYRLVEFCLGLPYDWKIRGGTTKYILRRALQHDLPEAIIERKDKKGFPTPMARWFRESENEKMRELLFSPEVRQRKIFNLPGLHHRVTQHCDGKADASWEIWRWLTTELWFRAFID